LKDWLSTIVVFAAVILLPLAVLGCAKGEKSIEDPQHATENNIQTQQPTTGLNDTAINRPSPPEFNPDNSSISQHRKMPANGSINRPREGNMSPGGMTGGNFKQMEAEAQAACTGKNENDPCQFGQMSGSCMLMNEQMSCKPQMGNKQ
jgi:hypothetical protein